MDFKLLFEEIKKLVEGSSPEDLKENFEKLENLLSAKSAELQTAYEQAVEKGIAEGLSEKEEQLVQEKQEELAGIVAEMEEDVAKYLDASFEAWADENLENIQSQAYVQVAEEVISTFKSVLTEHGFDIDEDTQNIVDQTTAENEELREELNRVTDIALDLTEELKDARYTIIFNDVAKDLSETDKARFEAMAENLNPESDEEAQNQLQTLLKENFSKGKEEPLGEGDTGGSEGDEVLTEEDKGSTEQSPSKRNYSGLFTV